MFKFSRQQKDHRYFCGNRYEKYSIKKLKVGAASVLIGAGFLFGYNVDTVEADSTTWNGSNEGCWYGTKQGSRKCSSRNYFWAKSR